MLFFDEIQACPEALSSLRFFYEKMPELHVIAAGSLLEFALAHIPSQGVGRIHSLFLYPFSFDEFLQALEETSLIEMKNNADAKHPLDNIFHQKLIDHLKIFYLIGGMPEIVKEFVVSKDILSCQKKINDITETLKDDFAKYKKRSPVQRLKEVFDSIALQTGGKFKYSNIDGSSSHYFFKEALSLIVQAGLAYKIFHSAAQGIPLGAQIKINKFKVILSDTGIHQKVLGLDISNIVSAQNIEVINKGNLAELFTGMEILKNFDPEKRGQLYYWHREKRSSNAEVDYLLQKDDKIIPIEVKAGIKGKMQSMRIFIQEHSSPYGIRISLENFSQQGNIYNYPLYAISNILRK
ncbi:MAG: ATP-binding protein [Candidatus Omnitrophica bacterium]|nr:ATP-binding protein [Candidatus Omnitrophota bacterium]